MAFLPWWHEELTEIIKSAMGSSSQTSNTNYFFFFFLFCPWPDNKDG
jgi:hypothetical protein